MNKNIHKDFFFLIFVRFILTYLKEQQREGEAEKQTDLPSASLYSNGRSGGARVSHVGAEAPST